MVSATQSCERASGHSKCDSVLGLASTSPNNSLKPTRRASGLGGAPSPPARATEWSTSPLRRVGVGLVFVASGGYSAGRAARFRRAA